MIGRTDEHQVATRELTAAAKGYRVIPDGEGWPMTPGRYGKLEHLGRGQLAAFTHARLIRRRLCALPGVTVSQRGDEELRVLLTPAAILAVARLLRCFKRRVASGRPFAKGHKPAPRGTPGPVEAPKVVGVTG